jgi:hypothetical protein
LGTLNQKVDFGLLHRLARARPEWSFVMMGRSGLQDDASARALMECREMPNIYFLPEVPHSQVPHYLVGLDVGMLCYRPDKWINFGYPLKLNEYFGYGIPVVSSTLASLADESECIDFANTDDEWIAAIEQALKGAGRGSIESRRAHARSNTWESKADALSDIWIAALAARQFR